jgi:hypothetical protein
VTPPLSTSPQALSGTTNAMAALVAVSGQQPEQQQQKQQQQQQQQAANTKFPTLRNVFNDKSTISSLFLAPSPAFGADETAALRVCSDFFFSSCNFVQITLGFFRFPFQTDSETRILVCGETCTQSVRCTPGSSFARGLLYICLFVWSKFFIYSFTPASVASVEHQSASRCDKRRGFLEL